MIAKLVPLLIRFDDPVNNTPTAPNAVKGNVELEVVPKLLG